jgi:iron complex outermembrane receptor protein
MKKQVSIALLLLFSALTYAQTTISGTVTDSKTGTPIPGVSIRVSGSTIGTAADFDGKFTLQTNQSPPYFVQASSVGFEAKTIEVTQKNQILNFSLKEGTMLDEVVVSASRTPEKIFESPVTIERFGVKEIQNTASADFYDGLENLKGVDINTNSLTFKAINTRGFATFANTRFMQLVDGMDNSAPALNFPLGNLLGMTETDIQSVELLPGASSALYGANAFNGILFMTSKNPFEYPGVSGYSKTGLTAQEANGNNVYTDIGFRLAHKFSDKWAAKFNIGYLKGTDWGANNTTGKEGTGATRDHINYDGINIYGDEVSTNIRDVAKVLVGMGVVPSGAESQIPSVNVSRTGYAEGDLTDYGAESMKADWGIYYRPFENDLEFSYVGKYGSGSTIYQGANRYYIDNFYLTQHKLEVKSDRFFLRGYVTEDNAGDSYDMIFTGININRAAKDDQTWFGEYVGAYLEGTLGGLTDAQAHVAARTAADGDSSGGSARFEPGSQEFQDAFNRSINDPDLTTGSKFQDNSKIYHADANYNFGDAISFAEIQVGGSARTYSLNSSGTIYTDNNGSIDYSEYGVYTQLQKKFLDDQLKLTASVRYDKSELFDGFFSPRASLGYTFGEDGQHNLRISGQTGFRNPTTQDLFIGLDVGRAILVGGAEDNPQRDVRTYGLSSGGAAILGAAAIDNGNGTYSYEKDGQGAYENSFSASSVQAFGASTNPADLEIANSGYAKPEQVTSVELGYRGKLENIVVDLSGYYNWYKDFLSNETVISPFYGTVGDDAASLSAIENGDYQVYQTYTNSDADINSYGASVGVSASVLGGYDLGMNYTYAKLDFDQSENPDFQTNFNTPEHKVKASFGHQEIVKNIGFNVAWRWSGSYVWEASFGNGVVPAFHVVDAQVNLKVPGMLSNFKIGATNLLGDEYFTAFGTGFIGSQYYVSWVINNF